jgi:small subunit ribosomal protein S2
MNSMSVLLGVLLFEVVGRTTKGEYVIEKEITKTVSIEQNTKKIKTERSNKPIVSKQKLLEAGTYFGHKKNVRHSQMKPYILTSKKGTDIIDIMKTQKILEFAYQLIKKFALKNASFIFVGTRKQAKETIKENAIRTRSPYVSER